MKKKNKILLIGDTPSWAFAAIIKFIVANLSWKYDFYYDYIIYNDYDIKTDTRLEKITAKIIFKRPRHTFKRIIEKIRHLKIKDRRISLRGDYDIILFLDFYFDLKGRFSFSKRTKIIKGIYTHGFPPGGMNYDKINNINLLQISPENFKYLYLSNISSLVIGSPTMLEFYKNLNDKVFFANLYYDDQKFHPKYKEKINNDFIIGWTGNPNSKTKGYYDFVLPIIGEIEKIQPAIKLKSRFSGSFDDLHLFYKDVDLIIVTSCDDAGPSMFMEASLMGIPSISTNVGFPAYVIKSGVNGFIVERDIDSFVEKILLLYQDKKLYCSFADRIREDYKAQLGREIQINNWINLFENTLNL
ncbi:MAG: glycosyltransferase [Bacteroidales bacterium]